MKHHLQRVGYHVARHWRRLPRFVMALLGVVAVAVSLTGVSMWIYASSGVQNIDLSRPGYEQARRNLTNDEAASFSPQGPLNATVINDFSQLYKTRTDALHKLDNFANGVLDDSTLGLFNDEAIKGPAP